MWLVGVRKYETREESEVYLFANEASGAIDEDRMLIRFYYKSMFKADVVATYDIQF